MSNVTRHRHRHRPRVEALESLVPLSTAAGAIHGRAAVVHPQTPALVLQGTLHGGYVVGNPLVDTGSTYRIGVEGKVTPLGETGDTAVIQTSGFIANGMATGTMTLSAPRGNVNLRLTGPTEPGSSGLPGTFSYTITGGTHAYRNVTGSGALVVTVNSGLLQGSSFGVVTMRFAP